MLSMPEIKRRFAVLVDLALQDNLGANLYPDKLGVNRRKLPNIRQDSADF